VHAVASQFNLKRRWLVKMQEQLLTRTATTRIMVFSRLVQSQILDAYPVAPANITIAPLGVDLERFHPAESPRQPAPEKLKLLFTAHNFRLKGLHCLLAALDLAIKKGLRAELCIVGNDNRRPAFEKLAANLGLTPHVRFVGLVDVPDAAALYRSCDALVHPTFTDHCSLVVLEALASGMPVITTPQNGATEFIEPGKSGIVIDHPRNIRALADALVNLQDRQKLAALGRPEQQGTTLNRVVDGRDVDLVDEAEGKSPELLVMQQLPALLRRQHADRLISHDGDSPRSGSGSLPRLQPT